MNQDVDQSASQAPAKVIFIGPPTVSFDLLRKVNETAPATPWRFSRDVRHALSCLFCLDGESQKELLIGTYWEAGTRQHLQGFLNATALAMRSLPQFREDLRSLHSSPVSIAGRPHCSYHEAAVELCERRFQALQQLYQQICHAGPWTAEADPLCIDFAEALLSNWSAVGNALRLPWITPVSEVELRDLIEVFVEWERGRLERLSSAAIIEPDRDAFLCDGSPVPKRQPAEKPTPPAHTAAADQSDLSEPIGKAEAAAIIDRSVKTLKRRLDEGIGIEHGAHHCRLRRSALTPGQRAQLEAVLAEKAANRPRGAYRKRDRSRQKPAEPGN